MPNAYNSIAKSYRRPFNSRFLKIKKAFGYFVPNGLPGRTLATDIALQAVDSFRANNFHRIPRAPSGDAITRGGWFYGAGIGVCDTFIIMVYISCVVTGAK